jgi:hypothetical protein
MLRRGAGLAASRRLRFLHSWAMSLLLSDKYHRDTPQNVIEDLPIVDDDLFCNRRLFFSRLGQTWRYCFFQKKLTGAEMAELTIVIV